MEAERVSKLEQCMLVTGGAGFIGVNFVRRVLATCPESSVVVLASHFFLAAQGLLRWRN